MSTRYLHSLSTHCRKLLLISGLSTFIHLIVPQLVAAMPPAAPLQKLVLRHENFSQNGVLVSRMNPMDARIKALMVNNRIENLDDYANWLVGNFTYRKDRTDRWALPNETLNKYYGDCEDFAFLNAAVMQVLGYETHLIALKGRSQKHAICVFLKEGEYYWFDNNRLVKSTAKTFPDLIQAINASYGLKKIFEFTPDGQAWKELSLVSE